MKFTTSVMTAFLHNRSAKRNFSRLFKFIAFIVFLILLYSALFHLVMIYIEDDISHSIFAGLYWTLTTMTTLGYGDIVFTSDIGRIFSSFVLISGVLLLLVILPFTFIQFFYAPWLEAYNKLKTPTTVPEHEKDHIIITNFDSVTRTLIQKLTLYNHTYYILESGVQKALEFYESGFKVLLGDLDDPKTYRNIKFDKAAMLVVTGNDMQNTNVSFTAREISESVPIVTMASNPDSVDILKLAGSTQVLQLPQMLGQSLARRTLGGSARVHVIGRFDQLVIGEAPAVGTPLVGKTLAESKLREIVGINVVGVWERGFFSAAQPETLINERTILVLAGSVDQLRTYDEYMGIFHAEDKPVLIIGAGRVGLAAAKSLADRRMDHVILDKTPVRVPENSTFVIGDAADLDTLKKAGIEEAHTIIITTNKDDVNIYLTLYCRKLRPDVQITARATEERNVSSLHRAGADFVMSYATMGSNAIFNLLARSEVLMLAEGLNVFKVTAPKIFIGKNLIESEIRRKTGCSVIAIKKNGDLLANPEPKTVIEDSSELILIGDYESEEKFSAFLKRES